MMLLAGGRPAAADPPIHLAIGLTPEGVCAVRWQGRALEPAALARASRGWRGRKIVFDQIGTNIPYRCVGAAIYTMQANGATMIGFISEPPPQQDQAK